MFGGREESETKDECNGDENVKMAECGG